MKQILQNIGNGQTSLTDGMVPAIRPGTLLIQSSTSLVSSGTERMLVDFGKSSLLSKARQEPEKVKMVFDKLKSDGLSATIETVRNKLGQPIPLGYCNVGSVLEAGSGINGFQAGDRVASNGHHAEVVRVPGNLCALVPANVSDEAAAFTVIGAIALQGIRLVQPTLGEAVVVTGLGLVGLMTVQLLRAQGCRVLGIDPDPSRVALARQFGAECVDLSRGKDPLKHAEVFSRGRGVDAVLITASTKSNQPVSQAAKMCRKRGRIVLVGVTGLELAREDFYEKELSFQVSCSYGPGRYDPEYEDKGHDYPLGFVRWTEQRNMEAVLDMMASGALDVAVLISHRFELEHALQAYELLGSDEPSMGILLEYPGAQDRATWDRTITLPGPGDIPAAQSGTQPVIGIVGAGDYAGQVLIPVFKQAGAVLKTIASSGGVSGVHLGKKHGFRQATTDVASVFADGDINTVVVATRHDSHAQFVLDALHAGKHVFVEKPLALTLSQVEEIEQSYQQIQRDKLAGGRGEGTAGDNGAMPLLMVGFNRRFAPQVRKIKQLLSGVAVPKSFIMTVNAGDLPADHWTQDTDIGGGRVIGEACHFIDLLRFLAGESIIGHSAVFLGSQPGMVSSDKLSISLSFADGSIGTVHYLANGSKAFPKERLEVFCAGGVLQLDNFRRLKGFDWPGFSRMNLRRQDKGQQACAEAFLTAIGEGAGSPIPFDEVIEVARVTIEIANQG